MGTRVTSKGQVTIPKAIRDRLGLKAGDEVDFVQVDGVVQVAKVNEANRFDKWRGASSWLKGRNVDELIREMRGRDDGR